MRIVICDNCGTEIPDGVYKTYNTTEDFCSRSCADVRAEQIKKGKRELVNRS